MPLLYSTAIFCFSFNVRPYYFSNTPPPGNVDITNRMTNIAISCDVGRASEIEGIPDVALGWSSLRYPSARAGPLAFFQGVSITRQSILVELRLWEWSIYVASLTVSPFFETLKQLTGFKTVTLRLTAMGDHYYPAEETSEATIQEWLEAREWMKLFEGFGPLLCAMSNALELALGNKSTMELLVTKADDLSWHGQCETIFHPQAHLAATSKTTNMQ